MLNALFFVIGLVLIVLTCLGIAFLNKAGIVFSWFSSLQTKLGFKKFLTIFAVASELDLIRCSASASRPTLALPSSALDLACAASDRASWALAVF